MNIGLKRASESILSQLIIVVAAFSTPVLAASPVTINNAANTDSAAVTGHALNVTGSFTPSGTQDTNLKQVNGATVDVGTGAASTGTQRVTTSTDSTIATITNPVTAAQATAANLNATVVGTGTFAVQATTAPTVVTVTDKGGTITTGGTAQTAIAANASRKGWCIQNTTASGDILNVRSGAAATATTGVSLGYLQQACNMPDAVDQGIISVLMATTSDTWKGSETQ